MPLFFKNTHKYKKVIDTNSMINTINIKYKETIKVTLHLTLAFIILGLLSHIFSNYLSKYFFPVIIDLITLCIFVLTILLKSRKNISQKLAGMIVIYGMILNVCILDVYYIELNRPALSINFIYSLLFIIVLITISSLIINFKHIIVVGSISIVRIWLFIIYVNDPVLWSVFISINVIYIGVTVGLFFIVRSMNTTTWEYHNLELIISNQNEELNKLLTFKDDTLNMVLHDIKNPCNRILSAVEDHNLSKDEIVDASKKILLLTENILDVFKINESKMRLVLENVNFNDVINGSLTEIKYLLNQKKIVVVKEISVNCVVSIDENLMKRVMVNLLTNAIKFSNINSYIKIKLISNENSMRVEVQDNGIGIPIESINHIFEKYYQDKINDSECNRSLGLGLFFCKLVMETHGGKIGVESVLDKGTTLWFEIPMKIKPGLIIVPTIEFVPENHNYNHDEKIFLGSYLEKLVDLDIYQTGAIFKILYSNSCGDSKPILIWKDDIINAVLTGNEFDFNRLKKTAN